jgi:hypothetical protein
MSAVASPAAVPAAERGGEAELAQRRRAALAAAAAVDRVDRGPDEGERLHASDLNPIPVVSNSAAMATRKKQRRPQPKAPTVDYTDPEGNTLTLRQELSAGTIAKIGEPPAGDATTYEDAWRRRSEALFERLAVRWEIAELPLEDQKMLLGRYRMADAVTQEWVRRTIDAHLQRFIPELAG